MSTANTNISNLTTRMDDVEEEISELPGIGPPDYDSLMVFIEPGETKTLTHNIGLYTGNYVESTYVVDLKLYDRDGVGPAGVHNWKIGGDAYMTDSFKVDGVCWYNLTETTIDVRRFPTDKYSSYIRVRIWAKGIF